MNYCLFIKHLFRKIFQFYYFNKMQIVYMFTFILLLNKIFLKKLTISFEKKINENLPVDGYMEELMWNNLVAKINLGTPLNSTNFMIRLQTHPLILIGEDTKTKYPKYNNSKSSSFKTLNNSIIKNQFSYFIESKLSQENFNILNNNIEIKCLLTNKISYYEGIHYPGLLGLGIKENIRIEKEYEGTNFIQQLKSYNLISSYVFTIKFHNNYKKGEIIIGEKPEEYNKNYHPEGFKQVQTEKITSSVVWSISIDNLIVDNNTIENDVVIRLKLESGVIKPTYALQKYLENNFFIPHLSNKSCFKNRTEDFFGIYYYCNKNIDLKSFPVINFHLKPFEMNFTLTYEDLVVEYKGRYFFLFVFQDYIERFEVGYPFLKKYEFVFDQDKKIIGMYKQVKGSFSFMNLMIFIFIFVIFCLLIFSVFILYKKQRRRRINEIDDNFDYFPQENIH